LLVNDSEARLLSGQTNLKQAASTIMDMGPKTIIIKRGEYGALLFYRDRHGQTRWYSAPGYLLEKVFDPTGAGDCFAGGFMGYLASRQIDPADSGADHRELLRAVIYGSVMGSFCCENFGVDRFRTLTRSEIDARFQEFQDATAF
jgi:sugar/nucleoside kinase (ribokinase family)